jgi:hypothetical protein
MTMSVVLSSNKVLTTNSSGIDSDH